MVVGEVRAAAVREGALGAVSDEQREEAERGFMEGKPPNPNLLACTPTLEMGVNIGDLEAVRCAIYRRARPTMRSGRGARGGEPDGHTAGFQSQYSHDGYFFDHPDEIIAGAIPPPKFNLKNHEAISRHIRSLVLEPAVKSGLKKNTYRSTQ